MFKVFLLVACLAGKMLIKLLKEDNILGSFIF